MTGTEAAQAIHGDVLGLASLAVRQSVGDDYDGDGVFRQVERSAVTRLLRILWHDLPERLRDEIREEIGYGEALDEALDEGDNGLWVSRTLTTSMDDVLGRLLGYSGIQRIDPEESTA